MRPLGRLLHLELRLLCFEVLYLLVLLLLLLQLLSAVNAVFVKLIEVHLREPLWRYRRMLLLLSPLDTFNEVLGYSRFHLGARRASRRLRRCLQER